MRNGQSERDRNREREQRARGNRKYGQAKQKHAKRGVASCIIAGMVMVVLTTLIAVAYTSGGNGQTYMGGLGLVSMILAGVGIYAAFRGFKEREKNYLTCKIGLGFNIAFLLGWIAIFFRGLI